MLAYNHEKWIGQAIESVLAQDFEDFEIVIGDDASTDRTLAIVQEYAAKDARVRPLPSEKNLGGRPNFKRTHGACRGDFINVLDGDDYFIDDQKLGLQVRMLDQDPSLAGCFTGSQEVALDGTPLGPGKHPKPRKERYTIFDFARYCMSDCAAMMYRRGHFEELPELFFSCPQGDWPLHMLNALHGDFGYIHRVSSAYRIHAGGVWNKKSSKAKILANLECQRQFLIHLPPDTVREIRPAIARSAWGKLKPLLAMGEWDSVEMLLGWLNTHCKGHVPLRKTLKARIRLRLARRRAQRA
ncbi:MAG: glycosyltransferase involved in cell wall biosynthesis [Chlamydiales bacterium]|jgi:glycosyltransferase involved in cell wall biosynthesis